MREYLSRLGLIDAQRAEKIADSVRDRSGRSVWRCPVSGVIFLDAVEVETVRYYTNKVVDYQPHLPVTAADGVNHATLAQEDDARRAAQFSDALRGRVWLDFGAGDGGLVRLMSTKAAKAYAVELNAGRCARMRAQGIDVIEDWRDLADASLDVVTMFHVFEHLPRPVELLRELGEKLKPGGALILEVPHANDFLINTLDCEQFKRFSFWSEHLVLHTRATLGAMLRLAGFVDVLVTSFQRYPLSNHLYWLRHGRPGGHGVWGALDTDATRQAYTDMLARIDQTDTLIAISRKPAATAVTR